MNKQTKNSNGWSKTTTTATKPPAKTQAVDQSVKKTTTVDKPASKPTDSDNATTASQKISSNPKDSSKPQGNTSQTHPMKPTTTETTSSTTPTTSSVTSAPTPKREAVILPNFPDWEGDLHSEYLNGLPNISGSEKNLLDSVFKSQNQPVFLLPENGIDFSRIRSACAIALHMHQPLIPAGGSDLRTAEIISNLKYMMDNQYIGDNHNAPVFHWCYKRIGEFIPQLVNDGKQPRIMLEYSGTLLYGLRQMGLHDVIDNLKTITCDHNIDAQWNG
jgi:hypothetical protein